MKYINTEKLIAEIEKWRDRENEKYNESTYSMGMCDALAEFRNHIVSLEILNEDGFPSNLKEAAKKYANKEHPDEPSVGQWGTGDYEPPIDREYPREIAKDAFKADAEWYAQQEQTEVDFERELEKWRHEHFKGKRDGHYNGEYLTRTSQLNLARYFYELRKKSLK